LLSFSGGNVHKHKNIAVCTYDLSVLSGFHLKTISLLFFALALLSFNWASAQTAEGGCTSVTVTDVPAYPTVIFDVINWRTCQDGGGFYAGCDQDGREACCGLLLVNAFPKTPRYWLEKQQEDGSWLEISGPQISTVFDGLEEKGTYRVRLQLPAVEEYACGTDELGNPIRARRCMFDVNGTYRGVWGRWGTDQYTNNVIVGHTTSEDISYTFIDIPETGAEIAYDAGETVIMDVSDCKNYDLWWLAIFESNAQTSKRYKSNGWSTGTIPGGEIDLSDFWEEWDFETLHQYEVQFVTENRQCRNGIEYPNPNGWNNLNRTFFICPEGTGCKFGIDEREIVISPNPANSIIQLQNFQPDLDRNYVMTITDMTGRLVKSIPLMTDRVDISGLQAGMFVVNIFREGERVFNSKLIVNQ
jgi:hypothetical protein